MCFIPSLFPGFSQCQVDSFSYYHLLAQLCDVKRFNFPMASSICISTYYSSIEMVIIKNVPLASGGLSLGTLGGYHGVWLVSNNFQSPLLPLSTSQGWGDLVTMPIHNLIWGVEHQDDELQGQSLTWLWASKLCFSHDHSLHPPTITSSPELPLTSYIQGPVSKNILNSK